MRRGDQTMKKKNLFGKQDAGFRITNTLILCIVSLLSLYPLYFCLIASVSDPVAIAAGKVILLPVKFRLNAYMYVFENPLIWSGYRNSIIYMLGGTALSLFFTLPTAYALSKNELPLKTFFTWVFLFTMYFGGGMVPTYLVIKKLGLINNPFVIILLGAVATGNIIITRTYFSTSVPPELFEAAYVDGASEIRSFIQIALPLSLPIIAVIALYCAVGRWNGFMDALLYLNDKDYYPLQLILRNILTQNENMAMGDYFDDDALLAAVERQRTAEAMRYALIFIASAPMIIFYLFTQKYFIHGLTAGAVKG